MAAATESVRHVLSDLKTMVAGTPTPRPASDNAAPPAEPEPTVVAPVDDEERELTSWGRLTVRSRVGGGAFGTVYRAWDPSLEREIALKVIRLRGGSASEREEVLREARMLAQLRNPNVVTIYEVVEQEDEVGLFMEFVEGQNVEQFVRERGRMSAHEAAMLGVDVTRALAAVHNSGLLHRDVKAQNVMREEGGRVVLMDFGLGQEEQAAAGEKKMLAGTPLYMAPELLAGEDPSRQADIYALGVLLYRAVTVNFPVEGTSVAEVRAAHDSGKMTLLRDRRADLPEGFITVVERAISRNPDDRFATAGGMQQALADALLRDARDPTPPAPARKPKPKFVWALAAASIALLAGLIAYLYLTGETPVPIRVLMADVVAGDDMDAEASTLARQLVAGLRESPYFELPSNDQRTETLGLMRLSATAPVVGETSRNMAIREGARLLVEPHLTRDANERVLTLAVVDPEHGSAVMPEVEYSYRQRGEVPRAIDTFVGQLAELSERQDLAKEPRTVYPRVTTASVEALRTYNSALLKQAAGQMREGLLLLERAVALDPEFASGFDRLADAYGTYGKVDEGLRSTQEAFRLTDGISAEEEYQIAGNYYSSLGDFQQARSRQELLALLLTERVDGDPDRASDALRGRLATVHRRIAQLSIRLSQPEPALQSLEKALQYSEKDVVNYGYIAITHARAGHVDAAKRWAAEARVRFPEAPYPHWSLALAQIVEGDFDGAVESTKQLSTGGGIYAFTAHLLDSKIYSSRGQWGQAERSLYHATRSLEASSTATPNVNHKYLEARIAARNGERTRAVRLLGELTAQPQIPTNAIVFRSASVLALELGEMQTVTKLASAVRGLRDEHGSPLLRREADVIDALIALSAGEHERGLALAVRANAAMPAPTTSWVLGRANEANGLYERAAASYEDYVNDELLAWRNHFPADVTETRLRLAELYIRLGKRNDALEHYRAFLSRWNPERHEDRELSLAAEKQVDALEPLTPLP